MIYVTGDFHGDKRRFASRKVKKLKKGDTLIICGDFGFLWNGGREEQRTLEWIGRRKYNVLFVEGTHDNLELLEQCPTEEWCGGMSRTIAGRLRQLVRGQRFTIEGVTVLALGGGQPDEGAKLGANCWQGVLPSADEVVAICDGLDQYDWQADVIVSHQAPTNIDACITHRVCDVNLLTALMDTVQRKSNYGVWCFGSYHQNRLVPPNYHCLYNDLYCAGGAVQKRWGR